MIASSAVNQTIVVVYELLIEYRPRKTHANASAGSTRGCPPTAAASNIPTRTPATVPTQRLHARTKISPRVVEDAVEDALLVGREPLGAAPVELS
jgi:hypothetical protein